jgi:hypothetical protein
VGAVIALAMLLAAALVPQTDATPAPAVVQSSPPSKGIAPDVHSRPSDTGLPVHPFRLQVGDRVRYWPGPPALRREATVLAADEGALTIVRPDAEAEILPLHSVATLEVRRGHRRFWRGLLVGAAVGLAAYGFTGDEWDRGRDWQTKVGHAAIVTGSGALAGAVVGGTLFHPHWVPVDVGAVPALTRTLSPTPLRLTLRF